MTASDSTPAAAALVAIDIAKVLIEASNHKRRRRLPILNNRAEHDRLIEALQAYDRPVICAFEATGNYHRPIAWRLAEAGFEVRLVSSLALARTREALRGARAVLPTLSKGQTILRNLLARAHINKVMVALASKMARIIWSVLRKGMAFELVVTGDLA